jgi:glycerol kinase
MYKHFKFSHHLSLNASSSFVFSFSSLLATIDQSTTATKFSVFDTQGNQIAQSLVPHQQISIHPGWLEHNPQEIFDNTQLAIAQTVEKLKEKVNS